MIFSPLGEHIRFFSPLTPEKTCIKSVKAASDVYSNQICFLVLSQEKEKVIKTLSKIGITPKERDQSSTRVWLTLYGLTKIKQSLDHLLFQNYIDQEFYSSLIEGFPKAHGGIRNLAEKRIQPIDQVSQKNCLDYPEMNLIEVIRIKANIEFNLIDQEITKSLYET